MKVQNDIESTKDGIRNVLIFAYEIITFSQFLSYIVTGVIFRTIFYHLDPQ